jgi:hypothetical protein
LLLDVVLVLIDAREELRRESVLGRKERGSQRWSRQLRPNSEFIKQNL